MWVTIFIVYVQGNNHFHWVRSTKSRKLFNCYQSWCCSTVLWLILKWFNVIVNVIFLIASSACSFPRSVSILYFLIKQNPLRSRGLSSADHSCSGTAIKTKGSAEASHQSLNSNSSSNSTQYIPRNTLYITYINMNFNKIFVFVALILAISLGQSDAGWLKKIGKKIVSSRWLIIIYFY